ncbi:MAG: YeeE/YedE family protein [Alphaproteobacteria bacterium]|nr:YeeE/YedE family protein [Alphaproteobacteria bacterium]MCB9698152.1 YeeE/YedE family protein [Alphaproteobacteria bacterium]
MLIGLAASVLLLVDGRIMGISGIVGGLLRPSEGDVAWRLSFLLGMGITGAIGSFLYPGAVGPEPSTPLVVVIAGLLVGFGTQLGNGCTSGHGVCGLSRQSPRSLVSVMTFMAAGMIAVTLISRLRGQG